MIFTSLLSSTDLFLTFVQKIWPQIDNSKLGSTQHASNEYRGYDDTHMLPGSYPHRKYIVGLKHHTVGDKVEILQCGTLDRKTISEDRATQPMDAGGILVVGSTFRTTNMYCSKVVHTSSSGWKYFEPNVLFKGYISSCCSSNG